MNRKQAKKHIKQVKAQAVNKAMSDYQCKAYDELETIDDTSLQSFCIEMLHEVIEGKKSLNNKKCHQLRLAMEYDETLRPIRRPK
jgi:hypothetical protein